MKRRKIIGIIFVVAALLKMADLCGLIDLAWVWQQPWTSYLAPLFFLFIGVELIISSYSNSHDQWLQRPIPVNEDGTRICCTARYGGDEYIFHGEPFKGARLDAFCGGIRMDLREAVITEDEEIDIRTFLGGVELFVPKTVNVEVKSRSFVGGVGNEAVRTSQKDAPCLHIVASNFFGGVSIKE